MQSSVSRPIDAGDIILLIASGASGPYPFDPIRLMKGCFVVSRAGRTEWRSLFNFEPYDYGPFDALVYRARDLLLNDGHLHADVSGRYASYSLTEVGTARCAEVSRQLDDTAVGWLQNVGRYVCSKSFVDLLSDIYGRYPEFASRSVARLT